MKCRYLCKHHVQELCQNLRKADRFWEHAMSSGMEAINRQDCNQAHYCFGAAYETAIIILDHQICRVISSENASNALLSAQYLATALVQLHREKEARDVLAQLHKKLTFLCRNPQIDEALRHLLCDSLIPLSEKLYGTINEQHYTAEPYEWSHANPNSFWIHTSNRYH